MSNAGYNEASEADNQLKHRLRDKMCTYAHSNYLIELDDWWKPWLLESRVQLVQSLQIPICQLTTTWGSVYLTVPVRRNEGILGWIYGRESVIGTSRPMRTHIVLRKDM